MMDERVLQKLNSIFLKHGVSISENEKDDSIDDFFGFDSISYVQMLNDISNEFGFKIKDEDLLAGKLTTFNNIVKYIHENQKVH